MMIPGKEDNSLLVLIKANEEQALKTLFLKYYPKLFDYAFSFLKNKFEANEAVSDVFFKIWQIRAQIDADMNLQGYLFASVRNQSLNLIRANRKNFLSLTEISRQDEQSTESIEQDIFFEEYEQQLLAIVNRMPTRQREVFQLSRLSGLTYLEIAEALSISVHTVQEHMVNALKHLRKCIKDQALFD
jgi:RNA polymerase sigma-70 factor, ECF subfamily